VVFQAAIERPEWLNRLRGEFKNPVKAA